MKKEIQDFIEQISSINVNPFIMDRDPNEEDLEIQYPKDKHGEAFKIRVECGNLWINKLSNETFIAKHIKDAKVKWDKIKF